MFHEAQQMRVATVWQYRFLVTRVMEQAFDNDFSCQKEVS